MISPEVFYVHMQGEQRGPYTVLQIDHMLNSGLIAIETLYWREGMEQWQPVTDLVVVRRRANPWIKPAIALGVLLVLAVFMRMFGPITLEGWRETNQHAYTAPGAYWRARDVVRNGGVLHGGLVLFGKFSTAQVEMQPPDRALVTLNGEVTGSNGKTASCTWRVPMRFEPRSLDWTGGPAEEVAP